MTRRAYETIVFSTEDKIARVVFNRPEVHNAFNSKMIGEIADAFEKIRSDESVRMVILTGKG
ncbi:MAG: enoyl-CoA hydratase-related protein, partial [Candidatus Aminicenantes bacterium]